MHSDTVARVVAGAAVLAAWSHCAAAGKCSNSQIVVVTTEHERKEPDTILQGIGQVPVWLAVRVATKSGDEYTNFLRAGESVTCYTIMHAEKDDCKAVESILGESKKIKIANCAPGESLDKTVLDIFTWGSPTCNKREIRVDSQKYEVDVKKSAQELTDYVKKVESYCGGCENATDLGTAQVTAYPDSNVTIQGTTVYPNGAEMKYRCKGDQTDRTMKCTDEKWSPADCTKPTDSTKDSKGNGSFKTTVGTTRRISICIAVSAVMVGVIA